MYAFLFVAPAAAEEAYDLSRRWPVGRVVDSHAVSRSVVQGPSRLIHAQELWWHEEVLAASGEGRRVRAVFERMRVAMRGPVGLTWDSREQAAAPEPYAPLQALLGVEIVTTYDSAGRFVAVEGFDAIRRRLSRAAGSAAAALGDDWVADIAIQAEYATPPAPVPVGATWDATTVAPIPGFADMVMHQDYVLTRVQESDGDRIAVIGLRMSIEADSVATGEATFAYDAATAVGELRHDLGRGITVGMEMRVEFEATVTTDGKAIRVIGTSEYTAASRVRDGAR